MNAKKIYKKKYVCLLILFLVLFSLHFVQGIAVSEVTEETEKEISVSGFGLEEILTIATSMLAIGLFVLTFIAYQRDGRKRLIFVTLAFFLYSLKGILLVLSDLSIFQATAIWIDPTAGILEFAILICFFLGILKKE